MKKWVCMLLVSMVLSACASVSNTPSSNNIVPTATINQSAAGGAATEKSLDFFDVYSFDKQLSSNLREGPSTVDVYLKAPASVNDIPERLSKWLTMVDKYWAARWKCAMSPTRRCAVLRPAAPRLWFGAVVGFVSGDP